MGWTAALAAFQIANTVSSYMQSNAQADAAARAAEVNNKAAWDNYYAQKSQLEVQANQEVAKSSNEMSERAKQAAVEQARIRNAASESGVSGLSVGTLLADSIFQEGQDRSGIITNTQSALMQNNNRLQGARASAMSSSNQGYNDAAKANAARMSPLSAGLQIAGSVALYGDKAGWDKPKTVSPTKGK
jgi:hypothetical protein